MTNRFIRMPRNARQPCIAAILAILWVVTGCATPRPPVKASTPPLKTPPPRTDSRKTPKPYMVMGKWYQPLAHSRGFVERGKASWYGKKFHGRKTSNGEIYDMYAVSAAHKTLPLGTFVRVENLENDRVLDVRINDRGPFVRGRIIDLSYAAAKELGVVGPGTAEVEIVALGRAAGSSATGGLSAYIPVDYYNGDFTFQVGAFKNRLNAERLRQELDRKYKNAHIVTFDSGDGVFYRVRVGRFSTLEQAAAQRQLLAADGFENPFIVAE